MIFFPIFFHFYFMMRHSDLTTYHNTLCIPLFIVCSIVFHSLQLVLIYFARKRFLTQTRLD